MSDTPRGDHQSDAPPRRHTILVVDDDEDLCAALASTLEEEGYAVRTATNGEAALASLDPAPDLILLDLYMPKMDGWAFMAERRRRPAATSIPVMVMTARGDDALSRAPVASGYLTKPIGSERLLQMIGRCLST